MSVQSRIEQAPACTVINLTEAEKDIYNGAGWKLARFIEGTLVELFDPALLEYPREYNKQEMANAAVHSAVTWLKNIESGNTAQSYTNVERDGGDVWLVMCSSYQLCEPIRITLTDASALAKMARAFGEALEEL